MKTNKSYTKRLRVTKTGKIIARKPGQNHFNALDRSRTKSKKGRTTAFKISNKSRARFLPGTPNVSR